MKRGTVKGIAVTALLVVFASCAGMQGEDDVTKKVAHLRQDVDALTQQQKRLTDEITALRKDLQAYYEPVPAPASAPAQQPVAPTAQATPAPPVTPAVASPAPATGSAPSTAPKPPPLLDDPAALYKQGFALMGQGQYPEARTAFKVFIDTHPQSELADNAQYWIGECFYSQKAYREAWDAFRVVLLQYAGGNKVPDALFKIGLCQAQLGQEAESQQTFRKVVQDFPDTVAASKAKQSIK